MGGNDARMKQAYESEMRKLWDWVKARYDEGVNTIDLEGKHLPSRMGGYRMLSLAHVQKKNACVVLLRNLHSLCQAKAEEIENPDIKTDITYEHMVLDLAAVNKVGEAIRSSLLQDREAVMQHDVYTELLDRANANLRLKHRGALVVAGILTALAIPVLVFTFPVSLVAFIAITAAIVAIDALCVSVSEGWQHRLFSSSYEAQMSIKMHDLAGLVGKQEKSMQLSFA